MEEKNLTAVHKRILYPLTGGTSMLGTCNLPGLYEHDKKSGMVK